MSKCRNKIENAEVHEHLPLNLALYARKVAGAMLTVFDKTKFVGTIR